jgi:hypothetical protein
MKLHVVYDPVKKPWLPVPSLDDTTSSGPLVNALSSAEAVWQSINQFRIS